LSDARPRPFFPFVSLGSVLGPKDTRLRRSDVRGLRVHWPAAGSAQPVRVQPSSASHGPWYRHRPGRRTCEKGCVRCLIPVEKTTRLGLFSGSVSVESTQSVCVSFFLPRNNQLLVGQWSLCIERIGERRARDTPASRGLCRWLGEPVYE
jgi:hypothetical protein